MVEIRVLGMESANAGEYKKFVYGNFQNIQVSKQQQLSTEVTSRWSAFHTKSLNFCTYV